MSSGIYKWTSPSGKSYIGQAVNLRRRKNDFLRFKDEYTSKGSAIDNARRKYNKVEDWKYEVLEYAEKEQLNELEINYIKKYNTKDSKIGYNSTYGGDGAKGVKWGTPKQIEAIKHRRSFAGKNNPNYGKTMSIENKEKLRNDHLGTHLSLETRLKKSKPVIQLSLDNKFIKEYSSITEAANAVGCNKSLIMRVCQGKKKTAKGFHWKYKNVI